jgi:hypothetical protein
LRQLAIFLFAVLSAAGSASSPAWLPYDPCPSAPVEYGGLGRDTRSAGCLTAGFAVLIVLAIIGMIGTAIHVWGH